MTSRLKRWELSTWKLHTDAWVESTPTFDMDKHLDTNIEYRNVYTIEESLDGFDFVELEFFSEDMDVEITTSQNHRGEMYRP